MAPKPTEFQPGSVLHDAIVGTFRAHGRSFEKWCKENGINPGVARNATFGQSRGPSGQALLARLIDAAGSEFVAKAYEARLRASLASLKQGAA